MAKDTKLAVIDDQPKALVETTYKPITTGLVVQAPAEIEVLDLEDDGLGTGLEGVNSKERRIPILRILDPKSPACKPVKNGGIAGAKGGDILNTATNEVYSGETGLYIVPAFRDHKYIKYIKREDDGTGGGFVAVLEPEDPEVEQRQNERMEEFGNLFGKLKAGQTEDGKDLELVETYYLYSICCKPGPEGQYLGAYGEFFPALVPFDSTKIKAYNSYIERAKNMRYMVRRGGNAPKPEELPLWAHVWHMQTAYKERGTQSWYIWALSLAMKNEDGSEKHYRDSRLDRNDPIYKGAEQFRESVMEGNAVVAYDKDQPQSGEAAGGARHSSSGKGDEDIPFDN